MMEIMLLILLLSVSAIQGTAVGARLILLLRRFTRKSFAPLSTTLDNLPTVSVCIPARNETHAMTQCLERVVASTYPKLEIIVLDDSSVDNTSILIKSFAHAGVRFVEGSPLPDGWLGKTHAQQTLFNEASGKYILFLDVDTHVSPHSIDNLIDIALRENTVSLSVLPTRDDAWRASVLFATLRHFWSIITHTKQHPAASSSAWLVDKEYLKANYNGFESLKTIVSPEAVIAQHAASQDRYRFLVSNKELGVSYEKKWRSQCETSIRLLFPFFSGRLRLAFAGLLFLAFSLLPFIILLGALFSEWTTMYAVATIAAGILVLDYALYTARVWHSGWLIGGLLFPVIVIQEIALLIQSVYAYATGTVTWKGRPIRYTARKASKN